MSNATNDTKLHRMVYEYLKAIRKQKSENNLSLTFLFVNDLAIKLKH